MIASLTAWIWCKGKYSLRWYYIIWLLTFDIGVSCSEFWKWFKWVVTYSGLFRRGFPQIGLFYFFKGKIFMNYQINLSDNWAIISILIVSRHHPHQFCRATSKLIFWSSHMHWKFFVEMLFKHYSDSETHLKKLYS